MKRVLAIGDVTNGDGPATTTTKAPRPPRTLDESGRDALTPRTAASLPRWVQNGGEWFVRWGGADTWFGLAARYLQSGKRWPEIWNLQDDRFHARVPKPEAIYVGALVRMPSEAVQRAELLGDIPRGSGASASPRPGSGGGPIVRGGGPAPAPVDPAEVAATAGGSATALLLLGALGVAGLATVGVVAYRAHQHEKEARGEGHAARPLRPGHGGAR